MPATGTGGEGRLLQRRSTKARVPSEYIRNLDEHDMLIPGRHLQLMDTVGQGIGYNCCLLKLLAD